MSAIVHLLSGGAAQGLVSQLEAQFSSAQKCELDASFGAVGMMKDSLLAGAPCDVLILTEKLVDELTASGQVSPGSARAIGVVKTGIAVKSGQPAPAVGSPEELKTALTSATGIYFPDPVKATAGIHFMRVVGELGLAEILAGRLRPYPNGASAMAAMAEANETGLIGCTQVTEILYTDGVELVAPLPEEFELATVYTAGLCTRAAHPKAAGALIDLLVSAEAAPTRRACGFE
jgi:molybdate transport system substrate-binding protein